MARNSQRGAIASKAVWKQPRIIQTVVADRQGAPKLVMAGMNSYTNSLRSEKPVTKAYEEGVPFFVPQLSKVKTSIMCQSMAQKLLFIYEEPSTNPLPYRKQGNQNLYTEDNLLKRQKLMENPDVLKAIERFWETFSCVRRGGETIPMHDYVDVFMKFYKALVAPNEFSIGEARFFVEKDWARDSVDGESMSKMLFFGSLFEVADIWTVDISAEMYANFLNKLFERVTMIIYDHVKLQWITAFAELDKIRSFDDDTPPDEDTDNHNLDSNEKPDELELIPEAAKPPLIRKKTRSSNALLPPPSSLPPTSKDWHLPELKSARREQTESESNNEGWGSSVGDDFSTDDQGSRDHLFERGPTKTRLEQALEAQRMRSDDDGQSETSRTRPARLTLPDVSPQHVLLPLPSIYLNPDLTHVHDAKREARRRLRENARLIARLRRVTF